MRPNSRCSGVPRTSITTIFGGILKIPYFSFLRAFWAPLEGGWGGKLNPLRYLINAKKAFWLHSSHTNKTYVVTLLPANSTCCQKILNFWEFLQAIAECIGYSRIFWGWWLKIWEMSCQYLESGLALQILDIPTPNNLFVYCWSNFIFWVILGSVGKWLASIWSQGWPC